MKGAAGELAVNLESDAPVGASASQRQAALDQHLKRFDVAAQRGRADAALVDMFKSAFSQLHARRRRPRRAPSSRSPGWSVRAVPAKRPGRFPGQLQR
jgi:hypothetical protein